MAEPEATLMKCPRCGSVNTRVYSNRGLNPTVWLQRKRKCVECGARWRTYEIPEMEALKLMKVKKIVEAVADCMDY